MEISCPKCGTLNDADPSGVGRTMTCSKCGAEFVVQNPNLMPCPDCFAPVSKRAAACPHCGAPLSGGASGCCPASVIEQEETILLCHPSLKNYIWWSVLGVITAPVLIGIVILSVIWFKLHFTSYQITNLRIVVTQGWIARTRHEIWIKDMREANLAQTFWQRILSIGDISIGTAATAGTEIRMEGVSAPQRIVDTINSLRR
ncbi:MAG: PH domain-containing protein [Lentisphaeria bacterium]|nr:PH domain-containing protein [Lentisphaeria bacterium]